MIDKLIRDSNFIGFPVGKLEWSDTEKEDILKILTEDNRYAVVYIFSDHEIPLKLRGVTATDIKVTYLQQVDRLQNLSDFIVEYDPEKHSYEKLLELVYLSGNFSRS